MVRRTVSLFTAPEAISGASPGLHVIRRRGPATQCCREESPTDSVRRRTLGNCNSAISADAGIYSSMHPSSAGSYPHRYGQPLIIISSSSKTAVESPCSLTTVLQQLLNPSERRTKKIRPCRKLVTHLYNLAHDAAGRQGRVLALRLSHRKPCASKPGCAFKCTQYSLTPRRSQTVRTRSVQAIRR